VDKATVDSIINKLRAKENIKEIKLVHEVDASLIGGFVLTYGDKQIDTSARKSLNRLKTLVDDDSYVKAYF
jgi:F-type H+-transporting ATPase subunit delta